MKKALVIFGSSRINGNTMDLVKTVLGEREAEIIDVSKLKITTFDYEHINQHDDFLEVAQKMVDSDIIIFATPVYWYSMSAFLKIFFDRLTDLIQIRKDLGRALKGKITYLLSCGTGTHLPDGYEVPFSATSKYFDMEYRGSYYYHVKKNEPMPMKTKEEAKKFGDRILGSVKKVSH